VTIRISGGSGVGHSICELVARTTGGASSAEGDSSTELDNVGTSVEVGIETVPLQVAYSFSGPGTISLSCAENGLNEGGSSFDWNHASIIALKVTSLTSPAVTS
jgi:hypothetical protein